MLKIKDELYVKPRKFYDRFSFRRHVVQVKYLFFERYAQIYIYIYNECIGIDKLEVKYIYLHIYVVLFKPCQFVVCNLLHACNSLYEVTSNDGRV